MAVEPLVFSLEGGPDCGCVDPGCVLGVGRDADGPQLARVMQFQLAVERHLFGNESLAVHHAECLGAQGVESSIELDRVEFVERAHQEAGEVLANVGVQHPDRTQGTRIAGHIDAFTAEPRSYRGAVHGACTSRSDHGEAPR